MTQAVGVAASMREILIGWRPCPECGYAPATMDPLAVGGAVRATLPRWQHALARPDAARRPTRSVWSALEHGSYIRNACRIFDAEVATMLTADNPLFPAWDPDTGALGTSRADHDPAVVTRELGLAGDAIATRFDSLTPRQLRRTGRRSDGSSFTIDSFARGFLHEVLHHLHEVDIWRPPTTADPASPLAPEPRAAGAAERSSPRRPRGGHRPVLAGGYAPQAAWVPPTRSATILAR